MLYTVLFFSIAASALLLIAKAYRGPSASTTLKRRVEMIKERHGDIIAGHALARDRLRDVAQQPLAVHRDEALDRSSDALCTALQLTNFWQDFSRDWPIGLPARSSTVSVCAASRSTASSTNGAKIGHQRSVSGIVSVTCDPAVPIGKGIFLDHGTGLVVGATALMKAVILYSSMSIVPFSGWPG